MLSTDDIEVEVLSYGPSLTVEDRGRVLKLRPDIIIAIEGIGTFKGVTLKDRIDEIVSAGKDIEKASFKAHKESTRRGHASLTTSLSLQLEVRKCSRVASMILVAPVFGSYLQESQRRKLVDEGYMFKPDEIKGPTAVKLYERTLQESLAMYKQLTSKGVEMEDSRYVLPLGISTSLFINTTFENYVSLVQIANSHDGKVREYIPEELAKISKRFEEEFSSIAPSLVKARLSFTNRLASYPFPNPFKQSDELVSKVILKFKKPLEPKLVCISKSGLIEWDLVKNMVMNQSKENLDTINGLISATFLEPLSLVAYHQAIRHRTVPTAVESIYDSASRALAEPENFIVVPPSIKKDKNMAKEFMETCFKMVRCYEDLLDEGIAKPGAVYVLPQALRIYTLRTYNGFNLIYPQGFVGTRTCSYAQWEERMVAYRIWNSVLKECPEIGRLMGEKCKYLSFCPEREWCPIILKYHDYNDEIHKTFNI